VTVLDASVTLAWALPDVQSDAADALVSGIATVGTLAPTVWPYEIASGIAVAQRRGRISTESANEALTIAMSIPIEFVHPRAHVLFDIANATGLSVFDASYLAVCQAHDLPLATFDERMRRAATDLGIDLL